MNKALILFSKEPIEGHVKTRLAPILGKKGAYELYCQLLNLILKRFANSDLADFIIYTNINMPISSPDLSSSSQTTKQPSKSYFKNYPKLRNQDGKDLGEKMYHALAQELHLLKKQKGKERKVKKQKVKKNQQKEIRYKVLLFGADCPFLTKKIIQKAFNSLDTHDTVFVPTQDGGYVLIGITKICPEVFYQINWSTANVMQKTQDNLKQLGYSYQLLKTVIDIDEADDLKALKKIPHFKSFLKKYNQS